MAENPPVSSADVVDAASSRAADQARIRKERREAKIRAGGSARLNKITGLGGGVQRDPPSQQPRASSPHADPEEVDISQHYYETTSPSSRSLFDSGNSTSPNPNQRAQMNSEQLRQAMLGFDTPPTSFTPPPGANPFAGMPGVDSGMGGLGGSDDAMMKMLQQMMGGIPGEGPNGIPTFPGMPGQSAESAADPYAYLWRIVHAVFALVLALYIGFTTPFTGTKIERERTGIAFAVAGQEGAGTGLSASNVRFFWIFATAEVLLQTSRFFLEKGRVPHGPAMGMVIGFLPEPWKSYLVLAGRYLRIWTTVSGDAMVCVFVLGVCAWLRSL